MSMFISYAPILEQTAAANASALPDAPQRAQADRPARTRLAAASALRRAATLELAIARRLERPAMSRALAA